MVAIQLTPMTQKQVFINIRNFLAGRHVGATRDQSLLNEVIKCLFCKTYIARKAHDFHDVDIALRYQKAFLALCHQIGGLFSVREPITLDWDSISFIDEQLNHVNLFNYERDPIGDAYECFTGSAYRGQEGQFFTPQNAIEFLIRMVKPTPQEKVIDPACGAGGFLLSWIQSLAKSKQALVRSADNVFGIDKDSYLAQLVRMRLSLLTLQPSKILCADSLAWHDQDDPDFTIKHMCGQFDVVLTNPPFGSKIDAASDDIERKYTLAHKWRRKSRSNDGLVATGKFAGGAPPQVLFMELCINLVRPGGRIGMVVPESLISGRNYRHVVAFIEQHAHILCVAGMPETLFKISGKGGTHTKTALILLRKKSADKRQVSRQIFMAEAAWCGHDSRGKSIPKDDLPIIAENYIRYTSTGYTGDTMLGFTVGPDELVRGILAPRHYSPSVRHELVSLADTHDLITVGDLLKQGVIAISTGDEVGKLAYGTGDIPFVRTSDLSNWEIKTNPKHCISREVYERLSRKQDVRAGDILMVKDGTYLIGTCAIITKDNIEIVYQSHLYKIRVVDSERINPYLLLALLSSSPVQRQIKAKRLTQDIIDSLGDRIYGLVLPVPRSGERRRKIVQMVQEAIEARAKARALSRLALEEVMTC